MAPEQRRRLYIVRHGVTEWNRAMRMQGHTDTALSEEGVEQSKRIGARLSVAPLSLQAVWSSDLQRARDTAEAIASPHGLTIRTTPLLREIMLGEWEGLTREGIIERGDGQLLANYLRDSHRYRPPGSEELEAVWLRMQAAMDEIRTDCPSGAVAIVGHGGSLRALICAALDAPVSSMRRLWIDNASLSIIDEIGSPEEAVRRVVLINDTSHLLS